MFMTKPRTSERRARLLEVIELKIVISPHVRKPHKRSKKHTARMMLKLKERGALVSVIPIELNPEYAYEREKARRLKQRARSKS